MKLLLKYSIFFLLLLNQNIANTQSISPEQIYSFTDRNLYVVGETIQFSVFVTQTENITNGSKILYCDIISGDENKLTTGKYLIENKHSAGSIIIPKELNTGNYYLRFYTKFMRNYNHSNFAYIPLKIINPNNKELVQSQNTQLAVKDSLNIETPNYSNEIQISTNKKIYSTRDSISIQIKNNTQKFEHFSITVVPKHSIDLKNTKNPTNFSSMEQVFLPEVKGISLSGKLINKKNEKPLSHTNIYLSQIENKDMIPSHTDSLGRFIFHLSNQFGEKKIMLTAETKSSETEILFQIDKDFEQKPKDISFPQFNLNEQEKQIALKFAVNEQLKKQYYSSPKNNKVSITSNIPFYGSKSIAFALGNYIELPNLIDYFTEIDNPIKIIRQNEKNEFRIKGNQAELYIYKPLVMLDWVVVQEAEEILALSPKSISYIEIINTAYLRSDFIFGGIINFISKNNDFAEIEFSNSTVSFKYNFLSTNITESILTEIIDENLPDIRNTLFWQANFELSPQKTSKINVISADSPGNYTVVLRGVNSEGTKIISTTNFEVKAP